MSFSFYIQMSFTVNLTFLRPRNMNKNAGYSEKRHVFLDTHLIFIFLMCHHATHDLIYLMFIMFYFHKVEMFLLRKILHVLVWSQERIPIFISVVVWRPVLTLVICDPIRSHLSPGPPPGGAVRTFWYLWWWAWGVSSQASWEYTRAVKN